METRLKHKNRRQIFLRANKKEKVGITNNNLSRFGENRLNKNMEKNIISQFYPESLYHESHNIYRYNEKKIRNKVTC